MGYSRFFLFALLFLPFHIQALEPVTESKSVTPPATVKKATQSQVLLTPEQATSLPPSQDGHYFYSGRGYSHIHFGKAKSPYQDYKAPGIIQLGLGKQFALMGLEIDYFLFENMYLGSDTSTYIKLQGGKVSLVGYLDLGWPELKLGISRIYYDAKGVIKNRTFSKTHHTTYGAHAGLNLPISTDFDLLLHAQTMQDVLERDLELYTLGFNFYF